MIEPKKAGELLKTIAEALEHTDDQEIAAERAMQMISYCLTHYKWVGVYWLVGHVLRLGPFYGAETDHVTIPIGKGVCGAAVAEDRNQLVDDVRDCDNYLACSLETLSEIVVLMRDAQGKIIGQIDADAHQAAAFDHTDEAFLEAVAKLIAAKA